MCDSLLPISIFWSLRYLQSLCRESSPRLGPGLRVMEKIISAQPESLSTFVQFGGFQHIGILLELTLPGSAAEYQSGNFEDKLYFAFLRIFS